jgi:hypothetical protein
MPASDSSSSSPWATAVHGAADQRSTPSGFRRRALLAALGVVTVATMTLGTLYVLDPADNLADSAPTPPGAGAISAPDVPPPGQSPGPATVDAQGTALPAVAVSGVTRVYAALAGNDMTALSATYVPDRGAGVALWSRVRPRLAPDVVRQGLLTALRTPPSRRPEVAYLYSSGDYGVGLRDDGTVAFFGTGQGAANGTGSPSTPPAAGTTDSGSGPTLGVAGWTPYTQGYGQVRPSEANAGGDGTSVVTNLHWRSWGEPTATATGTASWVPPNAANSDGLLTPALVTASDLGPCQGHLAYRKITWYFPSRGETPTSSEVSGYPDICTPM